MENARNVHLTQREREVCELLRDGRSQSEIAKKLVMETGTIYWYTSEIRGKYGVRNTYELLKVLHGHDGLTLD